MYKQHHHVAQTLEKNIADPKLVQRERRTLPTGLNCWTQQSQSVKSLVKGQTDWVVSGKDAENFH